MERVIIVGGGIGGLCAAIALRQIGCDVMVYERTAQLGRVGAGLTLWANALKRGSGNRERGSVFLHSAHLKS